jgi:hypothetical protein
MELLVKQYKALHDKVQLLEQKQAPTINIDNSTTNIQNNHHNTNININFINFDTNRDEIKKILNVDALKILGEKIQTDVSMVKQITDRVVNLVGLVFRNPEYKEMQGIYVLDLTKTKDNAFYYGENSWHIMDWNDLRRQLLNQLHKGLEDAGHKHKDKLNLKHYIYAIGCGGDYNYVEPLEQYESEHIREQIGKKLMFETISE